MLIFGTVHGVAESRNGTYQEELSGLRGLDRLPSQSETDTIRSAVPNIKSPHHAD